MRKRVTKHRQRFHFEPLESRTMLAGDVTVQVEDGNLVVTGDDDANIVFIEGTGVSGEYAIEGDDGTEVFFNGQLQSGSFVVTGATGRITVDLNGGDDGLSVNNVAVDELIIDTDEGNDIVALGPVEEAIDLGIGFAFLDGDDNGGTIDDLTGSVGVSERLVINTGGGNDVFVALRVFGGASWDINLGDEETGATNQTDDNELNDLIDGVALNDQAFIFIASGGDIGIHAGEGDDLVNVNYLTVNGSLLIDGEAGNDVLSVNGSVFHEHVLLLGGAGHDTLAVDFSRHDGGDDAQIVLDSGGDNDFVLFARSLIREGDVHIVSAGGIDHVVVGRYYADSFGNFATGGNEIGTLRIDTGGESDTVDIRGNVMEELFGAFGGGDDDVTTAFNHITSDDTVGLDGGGGFDTLTAGGNILGETVHIHGFEDLIDFLFDDDSESPSEELT